MASVEKLVKSRVNRCIAELLELRGKSAIPVEEAKLRECIEIMQKAQSAAYEVLNDQARWRRKPVAQPAVAPPPAQPLPNPVEDAAPRNADGSYVHDHDDPESDDYVPPDHPWRGQPDEAPPGYQREPAKPRGHWASATELAASEDDDGGVKF